MAQEHVGDAGADDRCPSCGAPGVGGLAGCRAVFDRVSERGFADPSYFPAHRLIVDAYSLQHPEQFMKSSKSAAAHLAGMCWSMERDRTARFPAVLKAWVDGPRTYARVTPPPAGSRGELTVMWVTTATDAAEHEQLVREWARSAWAAWSAHWEQGRAWVREAIAEANAGPHTGRG